MPAKSRELVAFRSGLRRRLAAVSVGAVVVIAVIAESSGASVPSFPRGARHGSGAPRRGNVLDDAVVFLSGESGRRRHLERDGSASDVTVETTGPELSAGEPTDSRHLPPLGGGRAGRLA